jgi:hypothetical protein
MAALIVFAPAAVYRKWLYRFSGSFVNGDLDVI